MKGLLNDTTIPEGQENFHPFITEGLLSEETGAYVPAILAASFIGTNYDSAYDLWTKSHAETPVERWAPCTDEEKKAPSSAACPNAQGGCPSRM